MKKVGYSLLGILILCAIGLSVFFIVGDDSTKVKKITPPPIPSEKSINISSMMNYINNRGPIWIYAQKDESDENVKKSFTNWFSEQYLSLVGIEQSPLVEGVDYSISGDFSYVNSFDNSAKNYPIKTATITPLENNSEDVKLTGESVDVHYYISYKLVFNTQNYAQNNDELITQNSTIFTPSHWEYDDELTQLIPVIILNSNHNTVQDFIDVLNFSYSKNLIDYNFKDGEPKYISNQDAINDVSYKIKNNEGQLLNSSFQLTEGIYNVSLDSSAEFSDAKIFSISDEWNKWSTITIKIDIV
ncbi:hypothetical protein [Spiroplasma endosymbiont of Amphibalanus improvisus]|uniref:hypothetical protein n=1 Tax=Spiroplasma endosymbiont of Amphibalanus improvisus TaxID=3066327 RepID=UPI00313BDE3C